MRGATSGLLILTSVQTLIYNTDFIKEAEKKNSESNQTKLLRKHPLIRELLIHVWSIQTGLVLFEDV